MKFKTQIVLKLKNSNGDRSQKLKCWQNSKTQRDRLHRETMDFLRLSMAIQSQLPEHFIWKRTLDISLAPTGAAEPQGQVVQGGGQLPGDRGVGQGRAAGKPGLLMAACCRVSPCTYYLDIAPI